MTEISQDLYPPKLHSKNDFTVRSNKARAKNASPITK